MSAKPERYVEIAQTLVALVLNLATSRARVVRWALTRLGGNVSELSLVLPLASLLPGPTTLFARFKCLTILLTSVRLKTLLLRSSRTLAVTVFPRLRRTGHV